MAKTSRKNNWLKIILFGFGGLILLLFSVGLILHETRPEGVEGPEAEALAKKMVAAVNQAGWDTTRAVSWKFATRNEHLWDRKRHLARVKWADMYEVYVDINARKGVALVNGSILEDGPESVKLVDEAWKRWVNDAFWLNAPNKAFDPGTSRSVVTTKDGKKALMISYASGGATPGDVYLWELDDSGLPTAWKMWVSIIPIGGVEFSWDEWHTLPTGAKVATVHKGLFTLEMRDVQGAATLEELVPGADPFKVLFDQ